MALDLPAFMTLHRHWMWSNIMRIHFDQAIQSGKELDAMLADRTACYMSIWYGMLYGAIEEFQKSKEEVPGIDLDDPFWIQLRRYRNAVFHPQSEYFSDKFLDLVKNPDSVAKIRGAHEAFSAFFLDQVPKRCKPSV